MKKKILITHPLSQKRLSTLDPSYQIDCISSVDSKYEQVIKVIDQYDALHVLSVKVDQQMMDKATKLRIISNYGVGYDHIDAAYAASKDISVANTPVSTCKATAEYTMGLILSLLRKITINDRLIRTGHLDQWTGSSHYGFSLKGKTLGILGLGRIGKEVTKMAQVFGMRVIYHNRREVTDTPLAKYVSLEDLMASSDILSIHAPSTESTYHIINEQRLKLMQPTAWLINTARGNLVDHDALIQILNAGKIKGAALDVFPDEPNIPEAFKSMDNVLLSPHQGTATFEDRDAMFEESFDNILAFFEGREMSGRIC